MRCPHCDREIPDEQVARHLAAKGGRKGKGHKFDPESARRAAEARWAKQRKGRQ